VVIEINETKVSGAPRSCSSATHIKSSVLWVALDDVGNGFSNMDRILLVRPDINKIRHITHPDIEHDYGKQGIFQSLINMANIIGALVIAEGVETEEEVIQILRLGGKMIQGYYFAKPQEADSFAVFESGRIEETGRAFNDYMRAKISEEQKRNRKLDRVVTGSKNFRRVCGGFDGKLWRSLGSLSDIECDYFWTKNGIQINNTIRMQRNDVKTT
jgi:predicted signal transduction protein with EAL and GGDEF domain